MSDPINFYQQQAREGLSALPWLAELQSKGLHELAHAGFPTRHHEDWKYTVVEPLLQARFATQSAPPANKSIEFPFSYSMLMQNGTLIERKQPLPAGVIVQSLAEALEQHPEKIAPYLDKILDHEHGFHALNTAMLGAGVVIYLPAGAQIEKPIVLSHWQGQANQASHNRYLIIADPQSQATIVEDYTGLKEGVYFTNTITEVFAGAGTKLTHYKIQRESKSAYHIGHLSVKQAKNSYFASHSLSLGGKLARSDIHLSLQEENACCLMNGIYLPTAGQHVDHHTRVHHLVPDCQSEQDYKGILMGRSRAVFNGKVLVAKDAQHTHARQQNKNLLLSSQAEIDTKPQLEIFADDVICTHGATVGQLDEEALFYLATRGIARHEASNYLIHAFTADNLRFIPDSELAAWMAVLLNEQLGQENDK